MAKPHLKSLTKLSLRHNSNDSLTPFTNLCTKGHLQQAFTNYSSLIWENPSLFSDLLKSCIQIQSSSLTKQLHSLIITSGASKDKFISNHLLNAYTKLGELQTALSLFDKIPRRNTMSFNILVGGFIQNGDLDNAIKLFDQMGDRNLASWNAMVTGCVKFEFNEEGLSYFFEMHKLGFLPDVFTVGSVLRGCAGLKVLSKGKQVHGYVVKTGLEYKTVVGSSLAHMYMKCGSLSEGEKVIGLMEVPSIVACNTLIAGRTQNGYSEGALDQYRIMKMSGVRPDKITFVSVLSSCAELAMLGQGQQIHSELMKNGSLSDLAVVSSLLSMYSRCGCLNKAVKVFEEGKKPDLVLWSAMISAYGFHGQGNEAILLFNLMEQEGLKPNEVTFLSLLYACSHCGLKDKGLEFFDLMKTKYKLEPQLVHYNCVVDLLGRSGKLDEAESFIRSMRVKPDAIIWKTLLSACKTHKNADIAKRIAKEVLEIDPNDSASYVLLANIQASAKRWQDVSEVRKEMRDRNVKKEPGVSWIELKSRVHQFIAGNKFHPEWEAIDTYLKELIDEIKLQGYVPDIGSVLHDMDMEEKEHNLVHHSEKLAIVFALMNTPKGSTIRVMKNMRVCSDCHVAIKYISLIKEREIIVRDASRFHHFKNGECSCRDYW